jgi:hypothetical protein
VPPRRRRGFYRRFATGDAPMSRRIEMRLRHDGRDWVAFHDSHVLRRPTLEGLDEEVRRHLFQQRYLRRGERARVFMMFDNQEIPQWIRQYSQHYFNRILEVSG